MDLELHWVERLKFLGYTKMSGPKELTELMELTEPKTFIETEMYVGEGFWRDSLNQSSSLPYPRPYPRRQPDLEAFLKKLTQVEAICLTEVSKASSPMCCLCDQDTSEDNLDYVLVRPGELEVRWPMGLRHYYQEHHVVPSTKFRGIIMSVSLMGKSSQQRPKITRESAKARDRDRKIARSNKFI